MDLKDLIPTTNTVDVELLHPFSEEPLLNDDGTPMSITFMQHTLRSIKQHYMSKQTFV